MLVEGVRRIDKAALGVGTVVEFHCDIEHHKVGPLVRSEPPREADCERLGFEAINAIADYVLYDIDQSAPGAPNLAGPGTDQSDYVLAGYPKFVDPDGYPAQQPPWGTLSALSLNTGKYLWRVPFGE